MSFSTTTAPAPVPHWKYAVEKTEMCKFFLEGRCTRGTACRFAHTVAEKRQKPDLRYASLCHAIARGEVCPRGAACTYAHTTEASALDILKSLEKLRFLKPHAELNIAWTGIANGTLTLREHRQASQVTQVDANQRTMTPPAVPTAIACTKPLPVGASRGSNAVTAGTPPKFPPFPPSPSPLLQVADVPMPIPKPSPAHQVAWGFSQGVSATTPHPGTPSTISSEQGSGSSISQAYAEGRTARPIPLRHNKVPAIATHPDSRWLKSDLGESRTPQGPLNYSVGDQQSGFDFKAAPQTPPPSVPPPTTPPPRACACCGHNPYPDLHTPATVATPGFAFPPPLIIPETAQRATVAGERGTPEALASLNVDPILAPNPKTRSSIPPGELSVGVHSLNLKNDLLSPLPVGDSWSHPNNRAAPAGRSPAATAYRSPSARGGVSPVSPLLPSEFVWGPLGSSSGSNRQA
uniref:C3H1-type domain-containing protein n=1 Tax=Chromera velia CCMP2878 TaxID=1169474 RepID=A0A0G4GE43_9ALVE|eukprot:Cvel_21443.t1-p1 / transcript=Cvel_21443.t1 / gene=Cvel_21443 / organism=Chromera_velia_CCMP2878 / gene_product=hypothetical protein / transcript_product=hypothetical protein / location=Cvel_scaffold2011:5251-7592(-) / protein_length=462 / sequence_SO=supercontig / SO=protein_coding / is_pseudo=false